MKAIASHNGLQATVRAFQRLQQGGSPLDACVEGVTVVEDDPEELTVGYGGLPNEAGQVELDAAVMDGRTLRGAGVAGLKHVRHATRVARLVMEQTRRVLLVGDGALQFALANGFPREQLLTERARKMWLYWKRTRSQHDDWTAPVPDEDLELQAWFDKHFYGPPRNQPQGTVHCAVRGGSGDLACATSTSGHAFKMPGRVGDSPILGAGLFADNEAGSCGSIGHGEANMQHLSSFAVVELMRQGRSPQEAALELLRRIAGACPPEEQDEQGRPKFNLQLFVLHHSGEHCGVSLWPGKQLAVTDEQGSRLEDCTPLF